MTTITVTPTAPRRLIRAALLYLAALTLACCGLWKGTELLYRHLNQPSTDNTSYASQQDVQHLLRGAWHTPATAGDFRSSARISDADVISRVTVLP